MNRITRWFVGLVIVSGMALGVGKVVYAMQPLDSMGIGELVRSNVKQIVTQSGTLRNRILTDETQGLILPSSAQEQKQSSSMEDNEHSSDMQELKVEITGTVEIMGSTAWVIDGKNITVTQETEIDGNIVVGSVVKVEAFMAMDGSLIAHEIELAEGSSEDSDDMQDQEHEHEVEISGTVDSMGSTSWVVDGKTILITPETEIDGDIVVGSVVKIEAFMAMDGSLTAHEIELAEGSSEDSHDDQSMGEDMSGEDDEHESEDQSSSEQYETDDQSNDYSSHQDQNDDHEDDHEDDHGGHDGGDD